MTGRRKICHLSLRKIKYMNVPYILHYSVSYAVKGHQETEENNKGILDNEDIRKCQEEMVINRRNRELIKLIGGKDKSKRIF